MLAIKTWMYAHLHEHIDKQTNELNCTSLVEAWDSECSTGNETLDMNHIAWDIAIDIQWARDNKLRARCKR
jgi:hypothetical protein